MKDIYISNAPKKEEQKAEGKGEDMEWKETG